MSDCRKPLVEVGAHSRAAEFFRDFTRRRVQAKVTPTTSSAVIRESR